MSIPVREVSHSTEVTGTPTKIEVGLFEKQPLAAVRLYIGDYKVEAWLAEKDLRALRTSIDRQIAGLEKRRASVN